MTIVVIEVVWIVELLIIVVVRDVMWCKSMLLMLFMLKHLRSVIVLWKMVPVVVWLVVLPLVVYSEMELQWSHFWNLSIDCIDIGRKFI